VIPGASEIFCMTAGFQKLAWKCMCCHWFLSVLIQFNIIYIMRIYGCAGGGCLLRWCCWLFALHMRMFANSHIGPHSHVGREFELKPPY